MTPSKRLTAGMIAVILVGVYSVIMMASDGVAAAWAWLLLVAAAGLLIVAARSNRASSSGDRVDG
jgi:hypothetical protein